ncbi:hypothetical protein VPH35_026501 [Triticum aestivum]
MAFWKEWGVQMLVLLSFALQVILLITAEIRRRKDSGVVRVVVWSAYLLADTTAIYTLGHMSVTSRLPREHELVVLWAPFLLLHLGGQDNITAYSIEDNRLWLRAMCSSWTLQQIIAVTGGGRSIVCTGLLCLIYPAFVCGELVRNAIREVGIQTRYCRSSKIARWMGREDWWNTLVYASSSVPVSTYFSQLLKKQVKESVGVDKESPDHIQNSRGRAALKKRGLYEELLAWSVDTELDESILVWHIATHVYLSWYKAERKSLPHLAKVTHELSNYMMFLLAARPYMLPDNASRQRYIELCNKVIYHLDYSSAEDLIKLIQGHGDPLITERTQPARNADTIEDNVDTIIENETFDRACQLGTTLISKELETPDANMLELITQVWFEILFYVGFRCRPDSHARQLSNGGEIITIVALMVEYMKSGVAEFN